MDDRVVISLHRHGLTSENERKAYIGWTDSPLSQRGIDGAKQAILSKPPADIVFSSPLTRCTQTAHIWYPDHELMLAPHFKEMNFGSYEGKTYDELKMLPHYQKWLSNPFSEPPDGGEAFADFTFRIDQGWHNVCQRMIKKKLSSAAIVTHGGVIRYLLSMFAPKKQSFFSWNVPCASGYQLTWSSERFNHRVRCEYLQKL